MKHSGIDVTSTALLALLRDAFAEEIEHLKLRLIRDAQEPRFAKLKESHPEIWRDFMAARNGPHERLHRIRRRRITALTRMIESANTPEHRTEASR